MSLYRSAGFRPLAVSAVTGSGVEELRGLLGPGISAFTGNSGVGKSSLLNRLDSRLALPVGDISRKLGRGRHTTRHVELYHIGEGYTADTPGFSSLDLEQCEFIRKENLAFCFREFSPYLTSCKFTSCSHTTEKGCAVLEAVRDGRIAKSRHDSYVQMYRQAAEIPDWKIEELFGSKSAGKRG